MGIILLWKICLFQFNDSVQLYSHQEAFRKVRPEILKNLFTGIITCSKRYISLLLAFDVDFLSFKDYNSSAYAILYISGSMYINSHPYTTVSYR